MNLKEYFVIDAHCDTLCKLRKNPGGFSGKDFHITPEKLKRYGGYVQLFAAWVGDNCDTPLREVLTLLDAFYCEYEESGLQLILTKEDIGKTLFSGKVGAILTVENGNILEGSLAILHTLYRLGVRALTLTWNGQNELCDGIGCARGAGLSDFGKEVVREMNRLGMIIDVSHLSVCGFWDAISLSEAPVMASHSDAKAVAGHRRNLSDDQIRALIDSGGFIGLNLFPDFLVDSGEADLESCLRHIEHMLSLGAEDILGLGSDFDGVSALPQGICGAEDYGRLFDLLLEKEFGKAFIQKLTHQNFLRFANRAMTSYM